ncbi:MAG: DUF4255 domain-containing protein [Chloroflexi bacterium]|nr:DUF4255 domain-containing protein [Chloroflexota bacterium]
MIESAMTLVSSQLNQYLQRSFDLTEDIVVVSNILEQDGSLLSHVDNKLAMFLVNIEKDYFPHRRDLDGRSVGAGRAVIANAPVYLNLYVMFAANFSGNNYTESLKFISNTIDYFQRRPVFDHANAPELDPRIQKLVLDIENLPITDLANLWGILSGKYMPSVLYRMRMVAFDSDDVVTQVPRVRNLPSGARR